MSEIDLSKKPEGATHYQESRGRFYRIEGIDIDEYDQLRGVWVGSMLSKDELERRGLKRIEQYSENDVDDCEWSGAGLPGVGSTCEVNDERTGLWAPVDSVLAHAHVHGRDVAVFQIGDYIGYSPADRFRPARTPEQIAAEEREKARTEVLNAMTEGGKLSDETEEQWQYRLKVVGEMLDLGYRKQVQP